MKKTNSDKKKTGKILKRKVGAPAGKRQTVKRREALLKVAGTVFVAKGFEATTMDEIAARAQVAKGTLYHYFSSKADLLEALRQVFSVQFAARVQTRVEACAARDFKARLCALVDEAVNAYFDMSELHDVVFNSAPKSHRHSMADMEFNQYLARLIDDGTKAGVWYADDPAWTALIMYYSFHGGCDEARLGNHGIKDLSKKISNLFLRMLGLY